MSPEIRAATLADAPAIVAIYDWYIANTVITFEVDPVPVAEMERRIATVLEAHDWLVLERGGEVLGYSYAGRYHARAAYRYSAETTIYLRHDLGGQGLGMVELVILCEELGYACAPAPFLSNAAAGLVLWWQGATVNTMILAGMVIAVGVVVDNKRMEELPVEREVYHDEKGTWLTASLARSRYGLARCRLFDLRRRKLLPCQYVRIRFEKTTVEECPVYLEDELREVAEADAQLWKAHPDEEGNWLPVPLAMQEYRKTKPADP